MIGIDEVGRGCWAGPLLVVAARIRGDLPAGLDDSKKITARKRQKLYRPLLDACECGAGWVKPAEIDKLGLAGAMKLAVARALKDIDARDDDEILMDGTVNYCHNKFINVRTEARADGKYPIVSAASIIAKVKRDNYMAKLAESFPHYGFEKHVGYGTALHKTALSAHGPSVHHRMSFAPMKANYDKL